MNPPHTLVLAYGNPLRGDDGVGPLVAEAISARKPPGVRVLIVHQLVPELIEEIKLATRVLFIDAGVNLDEPFRVRRVFPGKSRGQFAHVESPEYLLTLLGELEGCYPQATLLTIRALSLQHGDEVCREVRDHLDDVIAWVQGFLAAS